MADRRRGQFQIEYDQDAGDDLRAMAAGDRARVVETIEQQLTHEPARRTRNRFPAAPTSLGSWELRAQPHRVFYDVDETERIVSVRAILYKERERTYRRRREIDTHE